MISLFHVKINHYPEVFDVDQLLLEELERMKVKIVDYELTPSRPLQERGETIGITYHHSGVEDRPITSHDHWHRNGLHWIMVGYHAHIRPDGVLELGRPIRSRGAHGGNQANKTTIGCCLSGDMNQAAPTEAQYHTAASFHCACQSIYGEKLAVYGHNNWMATECPGNFTNLGLITDMVTARKEEKDQYDTVGLIINEQAVDFPTRLEDGRSYVMLSNQWVALRDIAGLIPEANIKWDDASKTVFLNFST